MTSQTIDGVLVPRDLVEQTVKCIEAGGGALVLQRLRALLDANPEENTPCPQCGGSLRTWPAGCTCNPRWPSYKADSKQPAAQSEPVEIGYIEHSKEINWEKAPVISRLIWTMPADQRYKIPQRYKVMLYAEQPAPTVCECPPGTDRTITQGGHFPACTACHRRLK